LAWLSRARDLAEAERRLLAHQDPRQSGARPRYRRAPARRRLGGDPRLGTRTAGTRCRTHRKAGRGPKVEGPGAMTHPLVTTPVRSSTIPEPGQLVEVRRRQWLVSDVDASSLSPEIPKQHLVKLASVDEDALGEEIEVLWELEPGAHVIERAGLPTLSALDDPSKLEAFLDAVRWGAATNAD